MVEMRWVEREVLSFVSAGKTEKVLQYRYAKQYVTEDGFIRMMFYGTQQAWSEWIDVPTVVEAAE